ncbi:nucleoside kinase [Oscillospiraceae bacterium MB08-C2-2]|nr:nucleoside kinase [Oscillospiraceae bacterium MB08-C2-2]
MRDIHELKYSRLDIDTVNRMAAKDQETFVRSSEEYYNAQVFKAATLIKEGLDRLNFVLLCGPSASGKTTTAHKLKHRLIAQGVGARVISMDNFFLGIEQYPKLPDGSPDMESIHALDLSLLNDCFDQLFEKGKTYFPTYDFTTGSRSSMDHLIETGPGDVLIMEGIHALNPMVLSHIPRESIFRLYVSVRTKFVCGEQDVLKPKDIRLIRRIVRDHKFRNYPPESTLRQWYNVVEGEKANIDPFRDDVDLKMDNTIDYEVSVWYDLLSGLLETLGDGAYQKYPELERIFGALTMFEKVDYHLIPQNSLLREFIGE